VLYWISLSEFSGVKRFIYQTVDVVVVWQKNVMSLPVSLKFENKIKYQEFVNGPVGVTNFS